jgi:hypothetical protein
MAVRVWKRILKGAAWLVGGALSLVLIAYLALCLINWQDQPVSDSAQRLASIYRDRPSVPDADNAYVYVMGFAVARDADPDEAGGRRIAWLRTLSDGAQVSAGDDPVPSDQRYKSTRTPQIQSLSDACRVATGECARALERSEDVMREWTESEQWLLDRYLTLLRHPGWLETVPFDIRAPLPPYSLVFDGQKLLLAKAYLLAGQKDAAGVRALLDADVRFWRGVLASSDILITKMIAVAALNRTFGVGNLVLRRLPADLALTGMPQEWTAPLTDAERSLLRTFTGEWIFGDHLFRQAVASGSWLDVVEPKSDPSFASRLLGHALMPMFQAQDLSNRRADMFLRAVAAMDVPYEQFRAGLDRASAIFDSPVEEGGPFRTLYNPIGAMVLAISGSGFGGYGARVADVEGARRAAVLATEMRSRNVEMAKIPAELAASAARSPYDNAPFGWDADEHAIVFVGLEANERGRHLFEY